MWYTGFNKGTILSADGLFRKSLTKKKEPRMKYNFDTVIDRSANRSAKYDERAKKFGTADVIPLWVADMDFRTAQPIIDA